MCAVRASGGRFRPRALPTRTWFAIMVLAVVFAGWWSADPCLAVPAPVITRGPADRPYVALTFDDNYRPETALHCLRVLREREVPATIFVCGNYVRDQPAITRSLALGGFEIADHTLWHADLTKLSWGDMIEQIGGGTDAFRDLTGVRTVPLLRPPYGAVTRSVAEAAAAEGFLYIVNWDIDTNDWRGRSAGEITQTVLSQAHNGAIVLMHLSATHTWEALPGIIDGLRKRGYELVTLSTLLKGDCRFLDVTSATPGRDAVLRLVELGLMSGYDENWFGPGDPVARAQLAKVAVLAAGLHTEDVEGVAEPSFADVVPSPRPEGGYQAYPFDYVEEAARAGIIAGSTADSGWRVFRPYETLTRLQLAQITARMARNVRGYPDPLSEEAPTFLDVPDYAVADAALVAALGLMKGFGNGEFGSYQPAQRAHVALVVSRFLDLSPYAPSPYVPPPSDGTATVVAGEITPMQSPPPEDTINVVTGPDATTPVVSQPAGVATD